MITGWEQYITLGAGVNLSGNTVLKFGYQMLADQARSGRDDRSRHQQCKYVHNIGDRTLLSVVELLRKPFVSGYITRLASSPFRRGGHFCSPIAAEHSRHASICETPP